MTSSSPTATAATRAGRWSAVAWRRRARRAAPAGLSALLASVLPLLVLEIWRADRAVPITGYASDGLFYLTLVKGVLENGWFQENSSVAAPFGQELYDFAAVSGDTLSFALIRALGVFSSDPSFVINLFFLASFPLTALAAFFVLRALGISEWPAVVCSVLFALAPYHFVRGVNGHVFLAAYYGVPLGVYLTIAVLVGRPLFGRSSRSGRVARYATRRSAATVALCFVVAWTGVYYALFTVILLATAAAVAVVRTRSVAPIAPAAAVIATLGIGLALAFSPNLFYRAANGSNAAVGTRPAVESEAYAAKLTHLVLPVDNHRLKPLADLKREYAATAPAPADYGVSLGAVATLGLVVLGFVLLAGIGQAASDASRTGRLHAASVVAAVTFLFVTVGGLSAVFSYFVWAQLRGWYRLSIFISFAALFAVGALLDAFRESRRRPRLVRALFPILLAAVLILGTLDQTTKSFVPRYRAVLADFTSDRDFVRAIERRLSPGSEVFQIPYVSFPESVLNRMDAYDHARGYLHSDTLEWSWGSMRGRADDWQAALADDPVEFVATSVAAAGFEGLWVDRWGYADNGDGVVAGLTALLRQDGISSANGRHVFFDLRSLAQRLRARTSPAKAAALQTATLEPLSVEWAQGFWPVETGPDGSHRWATASATIVVENPSDTARRAVFDARLATGHAAPANVTIQLPGPDVRLRVTSVPKRVHRAIILHGGENTIHLTTDAARVPTPPEDTRVLHLRVIEPRVDDEVAFAIRETP
jgi:hypothetical protein